MARLTYYEYSWDVTEPIAYFISAATGIMAYSFYAVYFFAWAHLIYRTQKEYSYTELHGVTYGRRRLKLYLKKKFDIDRYAELTKQKQEIEEQCDAIRNDYASR